MHKAELTDVRCGFILEGAGEPLLLIPGLGASAQLWRPIIAQHVQDFTVICPDNRGIGESKAKRPLRNISHICSDLVELLDYLDIDRAHVLGVSLGGIIAQRFAVDHPSRIDHLTLVSCTHQFGPYLRQVAAILGQTLTHFSLSSFARMTQLLGASPEYLDRHPDHIEQQAALVRASGVSRWSIIRQLKALGVNEQVSDDFCITAPTLVIAGEYDSIIPHCYARQMADAIPGSRFVLVKGAGHNPLVESPEQILPLIGSFLHGRAPTSDVLHLHRPDAVSPSVDRLSASAPAALSAATA